MLNGPESLRGSSTRPWLSAVDDRREPPIRHRMVCLHVKGYLPPKDLDHIDGDRTNCAISNLRPATKAENNRNRRSPTRRRPGLRGVYLNRCGKYQAQIE